MTKTSLLKIISDIRFEEGKIVIHPNNGVDLNLFQFSYPIKLYHGITIDRFREAADPDAEVEFTEGVLVQSNDCKEDTLEMSSKLQGKLGNPKNAILIYEDGRMLLACK
jgi:hypothetical protein